MSKYDANNTTGSGIGPFQDKRRSQKIPLTLNELDPCDIVEGVLMSEGYLGHDFVIAGEMREICPECKTTLLQLVLLQPGVKRAHMLCPACTRCFDACYEDGSSALL
ncbi:MAG: hypothetical protein ACHP7O_09190 [Burkholderiales bacterium]